MIARAERCQRILQPGHLERFNPAVLAIQPQLRRPMFFEAHRLSVFTPRALDVDVVLDLMIHDLDIVLTFAASPVREVRAVGLPILSPKVDIANVRVEFESGCVANFTASRVSTERVRKLRFFEPRQYVSIDYARQDLLVIRVDADNATPAELIASLPPQVASLLPPGIAEGIASGKIDLAKIDPALIAQFAAMAKIDPAQIMHLTAQLTSPEESKRGLSFAKPPVTPGEPLRLEILSFLDAVANPPSTASHRAPRPRCSGPGSGDSILHGRPRAARRTGKLLQARRVIIQTRGFLGNSIGVLDLYSRYDAPKRNSSSRSSYTFTKKSNAGAKRISAQSTNSTD